MVCAAEVELKSGFKDHAGLIAPPRDTSAHELHVRLKTGTGWGA